MWIFTVNFLTRLAKEFFFEIDSALAFLADPNGEIPTFFHWSVNYILNSISSFVFFVIDSINNNVGKTNPLSNTYDTFYTQLCDDLVSHALAGGSILSAK